MLSNKSEKIPGHLYNGSVEYPGEIITINLVAVSGDVEIFEQVIFKGSNINGQKIAIQGNCNIIINNNYYIMKKIMLLSLLFFGVACTNPEDNVDNNTDSARNANTEGTTTNTPPGPTTKDTSGGSRMDTSMDATSGQMGGSTTTGRSGTSGSAGASKSKRDSVH